MLKHVAILILVGLLLTFAVSCGGGTVDPLKMVPNSSNLLMWMDLSEIADDEDINDIYETIPEDEKIRETVEDVIELLQGLEEGVFFMDLSDTSETEAYAGIIIKGTFIENDLVADIEEMADKELEIAGYKEYKIYTDQFEEFGLAFISSDAFVFGSVDTVKDVIDVKEGSASPVNGEIIDVLVSLGKGKVKLAATIPEGFIDEEDIDSESGLGLSTEGSEALGNMESIGVVLDSDEETVSLRAQLCFTDSESAEETLEFLQGIIAVMEWFSPEESSDDFVDLIDNLDMDVEDTCLSITFKATNQELEEALENMISSIDLSDFGNGGIGGFNFDGESGLDFDEDYEFDEDFFRNFEFEWDLEEDLLEDFGQDV